MSFVVEKMPETKVAGADQLVENSLSLQSLAPALDAIKNGNDAALGGPLRNVAVGNLVCPEVTIKTEGLWTCKERKLDEASGGYLYTFKLADECDDVTEHPNRHARLKTALRQMRTLFPAVQSLGFHVAYLDPQNKQKFIDSVSRYFMFELCPEVSEGTDEYRRVALQIMASHVMPFVENKLKHADALRRLGYGCECRADGVYLTLPDRATLLDRWNQLRKERPHLPPMDIISMDGDVDSKTFLSLFFKHDVLLANGKEFVHDHVVHVMSALTLALDSGTFEDQGEKLTYASMKEKVRAYIKEPYDTFEPCSEKLREMRKQIENGANLSPQQLREMKLRYNRTLTLYKLMETMVSGVVDSLASYSTYETVMGSVRTPMAETLIYLLQNEQWGAHILSMTDAEGITLFEPEDLEMVLAGLYDSLESQ